MAFHLHRSERADRLVEALAELLDHPLADPMAAEIVSVPTRGVERWVAQQLARTLGASDGRRDGVCANVTFPFPGRLIADTIDQAGAAASGSPEAQGDRWRPERMVWPLLEVAEANRDEPWVAPLAGYLDVGPDRGTEAGTGAGAGGGGAGIGSGSGSAGGERRFGAVRHVADLFDRYAVHRPRMLRAWADGGDVDGHGDELPADCLWQAELWRRLRERIGVPSPPERLLDACARLVEQPGIVDLPERLFLFGLTRIPASHVEVLRAIAAGRDVHFLALHPSPALWAAVSDIEAPAWPILRRADPTAGVARHPLLASWGRDSREMQLVLAAGAPAGDVVDHHHPVTTAAPTLLGHLQAAVRGDRPPPALGPASGRPAVTGRAGDEDRRVVLDPDDRSVQVHDCHGRARQVEVVRDAILHLLQEDPTLEPRDVVVMCPDIDTFAPLIHASFAAAVEASEEQVGAGMDGDGVPGSELRVRLADRSIRQTNPVLGVVAELLTLAEARLTASQVLGLASREPVRLRFGLDDDDLARVEQWIAEAGIRWGLDGGHRRPYGLEGLDANTWHAGMDRLLLGAAMSEDERPLVGGVLPLDDVESGDLDLVGRLAELVSGLEKAMRALNRPQPLASWVAAIADAATTLTAAGDDDSWQLHQLHALLDEVVEEAAASSPAGLDLCLPEIRTLLADRLKGRPTRANFRTGHLTVCTMVPMRSVPHRVVCLLGIDDGAFPRQNPSDGDDLIERAPWVGDRDARSEDRQLLLDALLAATDHLVVTFSGRDERTNARRPPAVPLGELLDVVDATARSPHSWPDGRPLRARDQIMTVHPLQPFDARNFVPGALEAGGPERRRPAWSFDLIHLDGATALAGPRKPAAPFLASPLPAPAPGTIGLDALVRFLRHPVQAFVRQRLGVYLADRNEEPEDDLTVELDGLGRWQVGDRLLAARLAGADPAACRQAELARGALPPAPLGPAALDDILPVVDAIVAEADRHRAPAPPVDTPAGPGWVDVTVDVGQDRLVGTITGLEGTVLRDVAYSAVRPARRLAAWAKLLALSAARPDVPWTAVTLGQARGRVELATIHALGPDPATRRATALQYLSLLIDLYRRGMSRPLPLYTATSAAYAAAAVAGKDPATAAGREWATTPDWTREDEDADHKLVLGGVTGIDDVLAEAPLADEDGDGWDPSHARFGRYALRLWTGLLAHEQVRQA